MAENRDLLGFLVINRNDVHSSLARQRGRRMMRRGHSSGVNGPRISDVPIKQIERFTAKQENIYAETQVHLELMHKKVRLLSRKVHPICLVEARVLLWLAHRQWQKTNYRIAQRLVADVPASLRRVWPPRQTFKDLYSGIRY